MVLSVSDKKIAECIILAQVASDAAKWQRAYDKDYALEEEAFLNCIGAYASARLEFRIKYKKALYGEYAVKPEYIDKAVKRIAKSKNSIFRFCIVEEADQKGNHSKVTYFEFSLDGEKYQVSFHGFDNLSKLGAKHGTYRMVWDREIGGSRKACEELLYLL